MERQYREQLRPGIFKPGIRPVGQLLHGREPPHPVDEHQDPRPFPRGDSHPTRCADGPRAIRFWQSSIDVDVDLVGDLDFGRAAAEAELVTFEDQLSWLSEVRLNRALQSVPVLAVAAAYWARITGRRGS